MVGQRQPRYGSEDSDAGYRQQPRFSSEGSVSSPHSGSGMGSTSSRRGKGAPLQRRRQTSDGPSAHLRKMKPIDALWHQNLYTRGDPFRTFTAQWLNQSLPEKEPESPRDGSEDENGDEEGSEEEDPQEDKEEEEEEPKHDGLTWQDEAPGNDGLTWQDEKPEPSPGGDSSAQAGAGSEPKVQVKDEGLNLWLRAHDQRRDPLEATTALARQSKAAAEAKVRAAARAVAEAPRPTGSNDWYMIDDPRDTDGPWCWRGDFVAEVLSKIDSQGTPEGKLAVSEAGQAMRICRRIPAMAQAFVDHLDVVGSNGRRELWSRGFVQALDVALELTVDKRGRRMQPFVRLHREDLQKSYPSVSFVPLDDAPPPQKAPGPSSYRVPAKMKQLFEDVGFLQRPQPPPLPLRLPTKVLYPQRLPWTRIMWDRPETGPYYEDTGSPSPLSSNRGDWPPSPSQHSPSSGRLPLLTAGSMISSRPSSGSLADRGAGVGSWEAVSATAMTGELTRHKSALKTTSSAGNLMRPPSGKTVRFGAE